MTTIESMKTAPLEKVANVYAEVFAGFPWNEVSRCSNCGKFDGGTPSDVRSCSCGGSYSLEAYPTQETTQYIQRELKKQAALGLWLRTLLPQERAQGFGWGYQSSPQELSVAKFATAQMQEAVRMLLISTGAFFYISEVGVLPSLQGQGWGKKFVETLIAQNPGTPIVLRTNEDSPMRYISEKLGLKPVIGLQTGIRDQENESRVLFVGER